LCTFLGEAFTPVCVGHFIPLIRHRNHVQALLKDFSSLLSASRRNELGNFFPAAKAAMPATRMATGAVGTLAVQFARHKGATVIATASGPEAARLVRKLGAQRVIDARSKDAMKQLNEAAPKGIDAALILSGGRKVEQFLDHVRPRGRVAFPNGVEPAPKKRGNLRMRAYNAKAGPREFARLKTAVEKAGLKVPLTEFPLTQAAKAHERLERGHILGRIVLRV
jgi:NADPH2:quinone reductase